MKNEIIDIEVYSENFPNSKKVYVTGSKNNIKVPMRMIKQTTTKLENSIKINDPIYVYDTTGLYTDPNYEIDIEKGLSPTRKEWIDDRLDTKPYQRNLPNNLQTNINSSSLKSKINKPVILKAFEYQ